MPIKAGFELALKHFSQKTTYQNATHYVTNQFMNIKI